MKKSRSRVYVCHTFYHVYIAILKEFNLPIEERGKADLVLSKMSTNFASLKDRISTTGIFDRVVEFDEKRFTFFPELDKYKVNRGNIVLNMISRIKFTKEFAKCEAKYVPVDFKEYKDIYVFCDIDPIGVYLSQNKIPFHAVEDGYNCMVDSVSVRWDNPKAFKLKVFFSNVLNLIYLQEGFNKYCIDMEVNDIASIDIKNKKFKEVPRSELLKTLTPDNIHLMLQAFVDDVAALEKEVEAVKSSDRTVMVLTEHLCDLDTRNRLVRDMVNRFKSEGEVFIKPHPRDDLDYDKYFSDVHHFSRQIPMEIFNLIPDFHFNKVVGVFTPLDAIKFADEKESLGSAFMDNYEDPKLHERFIGVR